MTVEVVAREISETAGQFQVALERLRPEQPARRDLLFEIRVGRIHEILHAAVEFAGERGMILDRKAGALIAGRNRIDGPELASGDPADQVVRVRVVGDRSATENRRAGTERHAFAVGELRISPVREIVAGTLRNIGQVDRFQLPERSGAVQFPRIGELRAEVQFELALDDPVV